MAPRVLTLLAALLAPVPAWAQNFTRVQGTSCFSMDSTVTCNLPNPPAQGNLVVVGGGLPPQPSTFSVRDANGNNYTNTTSSPAGCTGCGGVAIAYLLSAPSNASASIILSTNRNVIDGWVEEYKPNTGLMAKFEADAVHSDRSTQSTNVNLPSIRSAEDGDVLFAACQVAQSITSANSPWSLVAKMSPGGNAAEDLLQSNAATQAVSYTQDKVGAWSAIAAVFTAVRVGTTDRR